MGLLNANGHYINQKLEVAGYDRVARAGILGNLYFESGFRTDATNSSGTLGIAQWLGDRKQTLLQKNNHGSIEVQTDYLIHELATNVRPGVARGIQNTDSVAEAAMIFKKKFESPGDGSDRVTPSKKIYDEIGGSSDVSSKSPAEPVHNQIANSTAGDQGNIGSESNLKHTSPTAPVANPNYSDNSQPKPSGGQDPMLLGADAIQQPVPAPTPDPAYVNNSQPKPSGGQDPMLLGADAIQHNEPAPAPAPAPATTDPTSTNNSQPKPSGGQDPMLLGADAIQHNEPAPMGGSTSDDTSSMPTQPTYAPPTPTPQSTIDEWNAAAQLAANSGIII